ncbi:unnamed protein product [Prorocentrum cordatum]|uniref:Uncharacterized protein n=1 Tax=Prorocentrum cordatum TaxID=2364126 RepID=A0ABN9VVC9_9DINO|nr:unnamed protein product [Polarella glacialis]
MGAAVSAAVSWRKGGQQHWQYRDDGKGMGQRQQSFHSRVDDLHRHKQLAEGKHEDLLSPAFRQIISSARDTVLAEKQETTPASQKLAKAEQEAIATDILGRNIPFIIGGDCNIKPGVLAAWAPLGELQRLVRAPEQPAYVADEGAADEGMPRGAEDLADFADFTNAPSSPVGAPWTASFPSSGATSPAGPAEPSGDAGGARLGWSQDDVLPMEPSRRPSLPQWQAAGASSAPPPTSPAGPTTSASARTTGAEAAAAWEAAGAEAAAGLPAAAPAPAGAEAAGAEEGEEECGREHDADQSSVDSVLGSGVMRDLSADELFDRLLSSDRP